MDYDFSGYATKHNVRCSDGRTIMPDAFKECDGQIVPLVWQHVHDTPGNVIGHAELENRADGVYAYCSLNDTPNGNNTRELIKHGDVCSLSIYANRLQQVGQNVMHGVIREVSVVLAGANPGATIDNLAFAHSDGRKELIDDEACISFVDPESFIIHADKDEEEAEEAPEKKDEKVPEKKETDESDDSGEKTIGEIIDTMNEEQKTAFYAVVGSLVEDKEDQAKVDEQLKHDDEEGEKSEDEPKGETIKDVLDTLDDDQKKAMDEILDALAGEKKKVSEETAKVFETFSEKQKDALYALVGLAAEKGGEKEPEDVKHADGEGEKYDETVGDVLDGLSKEQQDAVEKIIDAISNDKDSVPKETADVFNTLSDKQKDAVYALVGEMMSDEDEETDEDDEKVEHSDFEGEVMKYNVFDAETNDTKVLSHSDMEAIFTDAPRYGSLRDAVLEHGITDIEVLFPEAQAVNREPYSLQRRMEWVSTVLNGVHKSPFARIRSTAANLTEAQARAKGYIKGRKKIEEQIVALRRVTTPQTIYKLQKLDRDDVIDITDFDVVAWMKREMRMMLDEEIARAILVGDGRGASDPEKILPDHVRPVWSDDEMYTIHKVIPAAKSGDYTEYIDEIVRSRKGYRGSGNPVMFIGPDILTEMRLLKDQDNRFRYDSDAKLAEALRVSKIEEVELFDDLTRSVDGKDRTLVAIILNLADYTVGADKGGEVSLFDDFDLDYNKMEYLIETRVSGALTMPKSAIAIEVQTATDSAADPTYTKVTTPDAEDLDEYYEQDEYGRYVLTEDVAIKTGKTYFTLDD